MFASYEHRGAGERPQALTCETDQILPNRGISALKPMKSADGLAPGAGLLLRDQQFL
jgi:hypothetical protein